MDMRNEPLKRAMHVSSRAGLRRLRNPSGGIVFAAVLLLCPSLILATDARPVSAETVTELMTQDLIGAPGKEALMITVTYGAGAASLPHRHDAQVFVYVLEGQVTMQLQGRAPVTLRVGQTFYEGPNDIHQVSANASQTTPAKILVFMVKDKARPASRDSPAKNGP
jgi:quercetin dioxygenase-like cupin family protein